VHNSSNNHPMTREQLVPLRNNFEFPELLEQTPEVLPARQDVVSACHSLDSANSLLYSQPLIIIALY